MSTAAAKQDAFEESIRLKNQFRNLDEDEVEFLDSVLESTRNREQAVKKETREQLELFRRQQEEADRALIAESTGTGEANEVGGSESPNGEESLWAVNARKRKRLKEKEPSKLSKQRKKSLPLEGHVPTNAKLSTHPTRSTSACPNSVASALPSDEYKDTPHLAGSPLDLGEVSKETSSSVTVGKSFAKPASVNKSQMKLSLPNLGLSSYDSDDDE